jgi:glycyl-tRNA synthetase
LAQVLTEELGGLVAGLSFDRSMRWNSDASFARPVRWLLGLHGGAALPFSFAGLQAGLLRSALNTCALPENLLLCLCGTVCVLP